MTVEHGLPTSGSPSTEDPDPGAQHLYGVIWNLAADATLQASHAFNRIWYSAVDIALDQLGWGVWDDTAGSLVASQTLDPSTGALVHGWNQIPDLAGPVALPAGPYVVFGRWVGKSPYDLSFSYPVDGSAGPAPAGHITLTNGTFGFGALGNPRAGGGGNFALRAWVDAALDFGSGTVVQASAAGALSVDLTGAATRVRSAAAALGLTVTASAAPRRVRTTSGALAVAVSLTATPSGRRVRPGAVSPGGAAESGIVAGSTGPSIVPA